MAKGVPGKGPSKQGAAPRAPAEAPASESGKSPRPPRKAAGRRAGEGKPPSRPPAQGAKAPAAEPGREAAPPPAGPEGLEAPAGPLAATLREAGAEPEVAPEVAPGADARGAAAEAAAETVTVAPSGAVAEPAPGEAAPPGPAPEGPAAEGPAPAEAAAPPRPPQLHVVSGEGPRALAPGRAELLEAEVVEEGAEEAHAQVPFPSGPRGAEGWQERASGALALARGVVAQTLGSPALREAAQAAQGLVKAVRSGLGAGGSRAVDAYGRDEDLVRELTPLADFLYKRYWRVSVQGAELVPSGPVLLVANHSGAVPYDGPVLQQALLRERPELPEARWLVEDQIFYAPFFGTLFNRLGALRASPENALRLLDEGRPVLVFPEGVQGLGKLFRERYRLKRFGRGGFVKLALRAGVPIVPVAIVGAEESTPLLAKLPGSLLGLPYVPLTPLGPVPLPAKWTVRFGAPVDLEGHGPEDAHTLAVVQRLSERTRDTIQGMLESILRERTRVFGR